MPIMMVFAIVVIAMVVASGIYAGMQVLGSGTQSNLQTQLLATAQNVRDIYSSSVDYSSVSQSLACQDSAFPPPLTCSSGGYAQSPYGNLDIVPISAVDPTQSPTIFAIIVGAGGSSAMDPKSCLGLVSSTPAWGVHGSAGWLYTNGQTPSLSAAQAWCNSNGTSEVDFAFSRTPQ